MDRADERPYPWLFEQINGYRLLEFLYSSEVNAIGFTNDGTMGQFVMYFLARLNQPVDSTKPFELPHA